MTRSSWIFVTAACVVVQLSLADFNFRGSAQFQEEEVRKVLGEELAGVNVRVATFEQDLSQMFKSLPKNEHGFVGHEVVRYALHRFFSDRHGWFIRGLEPGNATWTPQPLANGSLPSIFVKEWVPSFIQETLEKRSGEHGASLHDMAVMAAALEDLVHEEVGERLKIAYHANNKEEAQNLSRSEVDEVASTFFISFLLANNFSVTDHHQLLRKKQIFAKRFRGFKEVHSWYAKLMKAQLQATKAPFAFSAVTDVVYDIGKEFHTFNDLDCTNLRNTLRDMESRRPGRVRLSNFYNASLFSHWRFTEKPEYLQKLGALDVSDPKNPTVIVPNYVMARQNCLDASNLYAVCCRNACESLMAHVEKDIGSATATVERVANLVKVLPSLMVGAPRKLSPLLQSRLEEIANHHGGVVPIHGRLFAQWMHHAYPLECPFPHEAGTINPQTPDEWVKETGQESEQSTDEEMRRHVENDVCGVNWKGNVECEQEETDLPWSMNEELLAVHQPLSEEAQAMQPKQELKQEMHQVHHVQHMQQQQEEDDLRILAISLVGLSATVLLAALILRRTVAGKQVFSIVLGSKWSGVLLVLMLVALACSVDLLDSSAFVIVLGGSCALYLVTVIAERVRTPTNDKKLMAHA